MGLYPKEIKYLMAQMGIPRGPNSNAYLVDPASGSDSNPGDRWTKPLASIEAAEALCVANQHDVVVYLGGASGNTLAAALAWDKSYTHLVGLCAPTMAAQRFRIFQAATLTGASPLLNISASGCIFKNFYIFQGVDDATSLINVKVSGGRNYFENVHFAGGGHATQAINGGGSLLLDGAEENLFKHCTIGIDTVAAATGMAGILFDGEAHRNVFEECLLTLYAGHAQAFFAEVLDATGIDRYTIFDRCKFINTAAQQMDTAFNIPAGLGAPRRIILEDCTLLGCDDWEDDDRGIVYTKSGIYTTGGNSGIAAATVTA